jgi:Ras-related protein Rab-10
MLLGNKCDMSDRRVVPKERGEQIAINHQIRFLETSAKANINIDRAFYDLAEAILDNVKLIKNIEFYQLESLDAKKS